MKRDKLFSALWAFLLSFMLSVAAVMCPVTAFSLGIDTGRLVGICFWSALICSICYALPLSPVPLGIGAAILGYLWRNGSLVDGVEAILNRLSRQYNQAYSWGIIRWGFRTADDMEPTILLPLCILAVLIVMLTSWAVCRKKPQFPALAVAFLPLASCFVVTDTVPKNGWLYLFFLAFLVLLLTGSTRRREERQANRLTLYTLPITALALLVLFAAIPRDTYQGQENAKKMVEAVFHSDPVQLLMGHMDDSGATGGEGGTTVDLRAVGYRVESDAQVLQVIAPYTGTLYLRGKSMDVYDGVSWSSSDLYYGRLLWPEEGLATAGEVTITTRFAHRMLYTPYYTDTLQLLNISGGMENQHKLTQYSFQCKKLENPAHLTKLYPTTDSRADEDQLKLATDFVKELPRSEDVLRWSTSVATEIAGSYTSPYHKAQAIAAYVRNSASYDTQTSRMPLESTDFAKWFLEESDTGYCVHFATATAVLLQAAGIPARYVTGYLVPVVAGEATPVLSSQAHAWVEYWLPGYGWTVLEATPADQLDTTPTPQQTTEATEAPEETEPPETTEPTVMTPETPVAETREKDPVLTVLLILLGIAATLCALEAQRAIRLAKRRKARQTATPNRLALLYWGALERYSAVLRQPLPEELLDIAQLAKYSQHTVSAEQLQQLSQAENDRLAQLKHRNFLKRLYYRWILALY